MVTLDSLATNIQSLAITINSLDAKFDKKMDSMLSSVSVALGALDRKIDQRFDFLNKKIDERVDELAAMTARGFTEVYSRIDGLENRLDIIDERLETVEGNYVTKDDLVALEKNIGRKLDKHMGLFRKDYDELAGRTKNLENVVFAT